MEKSENLTPEQIELINLQKEQTNSLNWTAENAHRLLELQIPKHTITQAQKEALKRQSKAGFGNEPELTDEERRLIQEVNKLR